MFKIFDNSKLAVAFSESRMEPLSIKPGLHKPQVQVEWSVTLVYSIVVDLSAQSERRSTTIE